MELLTKDDAKVAIEKCDLTNKLNFRPSVQNTLSNLLKVDEVILEEEPFIVNVKAEIKEVTEDEVVVEVAPIRSKAKKHTHEVVKKENE
jgi:tetrahydromethanopterin S-methyltransferase subunit A